MEELLGLACGLVIVLAVVALVGHGIVLLVQWLVAAFTGTSSHPAKPPASPYCKRCGAKREQDARPCPVCRFPEKLPEQPPTAAGLQAVLDQAARFRRFGLLDEETFSRLQTTLVGERERLAEARQSEVVEMDDVEIVEEVEEPVMNLGELDELEEVEEEAAEDVGEELSVAERAGRYAQHREAAAEEETEAPQPQQPPKERLTRLLTAFLEEKNIRWGELVGGLLIVGCSIALVLSFWAEIAQRPWLKFGLFGGVTSALFGVGLYVHRRWKLPNTSHGILITAALLVPLNFLAIAAFIEAPGVQNIWTLAGELLSIALFAVLLERAARVLTPEAAWQMTLGVMIPSVWQLLTRRWVGADSSPLLLIAMAALPVASYLGITAAVLGWKPREQAVDERTVNQWFKLGGLVAFATLLPLGLLLAKSGRPLWALHYCSPLLGLAGLAPAWLGLHVWRRLPGGEMGGMRTAGLSIAVVGALLMVAGAWLAWPMPVLMISVGLIDFAVLSGLALVFRVPAAHVVATLCLAAIWLTGYHAILGHTDWLASDGPPMAAAMLSAESGAALTPFAVLVGVMVGLWRRIGREEIARWYAAAAGCVAAVSLALVTWFGFGQAGDPPHATWVYAFYAAAALFAAVRLKDAAASWAGWAGSLLLLAAAVQGAVFRWEDILRIHHRWAFALLVHAGLTTLGAIADRLRSLRTSPLFLPFSGSGLATSLLAAAVVGFSAAEVPAFATAQYAVAIGSVWLVLSLAGWLRLFAAAQTAYAVAVVAAVTNRVADLGWFREAEIPWLQPWFLQAQGIALAAFCIGWIMLRLVVDRIHAALQVAGSEAGGFQQQVDGDSKDRSSAGAVARFLETCRRALSPAVPRVDQILSGAVLAGAVALATYAAVPGVAQELAPWQGASTTGRPPRVVPPATAFAIPAIPHVRAAGAGGWLLLAAAAAMLLVGLWESAGTNRALALLLVIAACCPMAAAAWREQVAVASALRWLLAGFLPLASLPIWFRRPVRIAADRIGWQANGASSSLAHRATTVLVVLVFVPLLLMVIYIAVAVLQLTRLDSGTAAALVQLAFLAAVALAASLILQQLAGSANILAGPSRSTKARLAGHVVMFLGITPLLVLGLFILAAALRRHPIVGPEPDAWFAQVGLPVSYAVPVLIMALGIIGHAVRERSAGFAFAAGLLLSVSATAAYLLALTRWGLKLDAVQWVRVGQVNAVVAAGCGLAWLASLRLWQRRVEGTRATPRLLVTQASLAVALIALTIAAGVAGVVFEPRLPQFALAAAHWPGWIGLVLAAAAAVGVKQKGEQKDEQSGWATSLAWWLLALASMVALAVGRFDTGNWLTYHTLEAAYLALAGAMIGLAFWGSTRERTDWQSAGVAWSTGIGGLLVLLALRAVVSDPAHPWWTVGVLAGVAVVQTCAAAVSRRRLPLYAAAILVNVATSVWWIAEGYRLTPATGGAALVEFFLVNAIALALPCAAWVLIELRRVAPVEEASKRPGRVPGVHRVASTIALFIVLAFTALGLWNDAAGGGSEVSPVVSGTALLAAAAGVLACMWDQATRFAVATLYLLGLAASATLLDQLDLRGDLFDWMLAILLAAYSLATSYLWSRRRGLRELADWLKMPRAPDEPMGGHRWIVSANSLIAAGVLVLVAWVELSFESFALRMLAAYAALSQALAIGLLARGERRSWLQTASLLVGVVGAVLFGWVFLSPGGPAPLLHRAVVVTVALAAMICLYGLGLTKLLRRENEWTRAAQGLVPGLISTGAGVLLFVLAVEGVWFARQGAVPIAWPALIAVALALLGLTCAALAAAMLPGRDPLALPERARSVYVYAAEVVLALLFVHARLTMPWLFTGFFQRYWPLLVMLLAFAGVGVAEWFGRRRQAVLSEPLERTGAFLPLLPVLGVWLQPAAVHYSLVLLSVGALYATLSVMRRSFTFGILAALAANGSLWYLLYRADGLSLAEHPQLWLIPPALCVLVAAYLNRRDLSEGQLAAVRYGCAIVIYTASTADIFLNGVAQAPWLPFVLAGLSLAGVFAGIWLRVRAFLFLGLSFLVLALLTMIWYAAVDLEQTWLWSVTGIITGILIIALFAVFEKKRHQVLQLVDELKQWEA